MLVAVLVIFVMAWLPNIIAELVYYFKLFHGKQECLRTDIVNQPSLINLFSIVRSNLAIHLSDTPFAIR